MPKYYDLYKNIPWIQFWITYKSNKMSGMILKYKYPWLQFKALQGILI